MEPLIALKCKALDSVENAVLITDKAGVIQWVNVAFTRLTGYTAEEVLGQNPTILKSGHHDSFFYKEMWDTILAGRVWQGELENRRKDGSVYLERMTITPVPDDQGGDPAYFVAVKENFTNRRESERKLEVLNEIARLVNSRLDLKSVLGTLVQALEGSFEFARLAIYTLDSKQEALIVAAFREVNHPRKKRGTSLRERVPVKGSRFEPCLEARETVYIRNIEEELPELPAGSASAAHVKRMIDRGVRSEVIVPIYQEDRLLGALTMGRNRAGGFSDEDLQFLNNVGLHLGIAMHNAILYTELQYAYERVQKSQEAVVQQERLRALGTMASGIAHDFNNALSPIMGFSELLLMDPGLRQDQERSRQLIETIHTASKDAASVVDRLREFYRPRQSNDFARFDLGPLIDKIVKLTRPRWKDEAQRQGKTIQVESHLLYRGPVWGSESELREMLTNLIFNAVDAIGFEGMVTLASCLNGEEVILEVTDTGRGMPEDVRQRCLEPFYTTKGDEGTGMGLAMVYGTVKRHRGAIDIESAEGIGTSIRIRLPRRQTPSELAMPIAEAPDTSSPLHVLVVEDEPLVRDTITQYLKLLGHSHDSAANGLEGLGRLNENQYDVILTDRGMPGMNGDQFVECVRQFRPDQPIIMLTGFGQMMEASGEELEGVDAVLGKPVHAEALRETLERVTGKLSEMAGPFENS